MSRNTSAHSRRRSSEPITARHEPGRQDGRIRSVPWEPSEPVYTAWDLGLDDATAIWFAQVIGSEIRLIDYYETNNTPLRDIPRVLMNEKP